MRVIPREVVFKDRDGDFEDELEVRELRSQIDGLTEWTKMGATSYTVKSDLQNRARKISVDVQSSPALTWSHGDVMFELSTSWTTDQKEPGFRIREWVCLTTKFEASRPCSDHIEQQRKIVALLTLMYGKSIVFRRHDILDQRFNAKVLTGAVVDVPFFELISEDTVSDYWRALPEDLKHPLVTATKLGIEGLELWLANFEEWSRVIQPAAGTLRRPES